MPHENLAARENSRQELVTRDMWLGSAASYKTYKTIYEDAAIADNEKYAVFQAELYRQKPAAERSFMDSVYVWMVDHRKTAAFRAFASLCGFAYNAPGNTLFMTALRVASYLMAALCALAAVRTGQWGKYFCYGVVVLGLSYLCTRFASPKPSDTDAGQPADDL